MKLYQILVKYNQDRQIIDFLLIKKGYSINALLFGIFWFLYQTMWFQTFALLIFHLILLKIENNNIILFYSIIVSLIIFLYANEWLIADLIENKKYEEKSIICANNNKDAEINMIELLIKKHPEQTDEILNISLGISRSNIAQKIYNKINNFYYKNKK
ncbi:MAG: hypothetical protein LW595_02365 [Rickettsiales bacterium]|jgi:hypothetical protein|nr:hypothetical protein [Rickettsiales bacterium]